MTTLELYTKGARVWIPNTEKVWEGAELTEDYNPSRPTLNVVTEHNEGKTLNIKSAKDLPFLRNPPILIGENDLTSLSCLHEPAFFTICKLDFAKIELFTRTVVLFWLPSILTMNFPYTMPKGSDRSWTEKLYLKSMKYSHFGKARFGTSAFTIDHFADKVQYESNGFLEKNRDTVMEEQISVIKSSKSGLVMKLFCEDHSKLVVPGATKLKVSAKPMANTHKSHKKFVGSRFRDSLNLLMTTLNSTTPPYIRCIKPNDTKTSFEYNPHRALQQLQACGILETIRISAAGFPSCLSYLHFFYRYRVLCKFKDITRNDMRNTCQSILQLYIKNSDVYQFGKTNIFFRAGQVLYLEKIRSDKLPKCCIIMQSTVRVFICKKKYLRMRNAIYNVQRYARGYLARRKFAVPEQLSKYRESVKRVQYNYLRRIIAGIQRYSRGYLARQRFMSLKYNAKATIIQRYVRGWLARLHYKKRLRQIIICQAAIRRYLARRQYKKLKIEARSIEHVKKLNVGLENKIISLQQKIDEVNNKQNNEYKKKENEVVDLRNKLATFRTLEIEINNLNNLLTEKNKKIEELENRIRIELDEKMDIIHEQEKFKDETKEQLKLSGEKMAKMRKEIENMNEIAKVTEKDVEENLKVRLEQEKLLILNKQDNDRHAHQKLLQEYHCLEQHYENLEKQVNQNRQGFHVRNISDVSSIFTIDESLISTSYLPEDHGSVRSTTSSGSSSHVTLENIDRKNDVNASDQVSTTQTTDIKQEPEPILDVGLVLQLQRKLAEVEREKMRLQKRVDELDTSQRQQRILSENKQLELELQGEKYKAHVKEYKLEIKKLKEDNQRQQRILSENLKTPETQTEAFMQHEITRLARENLDLHDKNDSLNESVRKLINHVKLLMKKLKDSTYYICE